MEKKFVVIVNGGLWMGGQVFTLDGMKQTFRDEGIDKWELEDGDELEFEEGIMELIEYGKCEDSLIICNDVFVEVGDDGCSLGIWELKF